MRRGTRSAMEKGASLGIIDRAWIARKASFGHQRRTPNNGDVQGNILLIYFEFVAYVRRVLATISCMSSSLHVCRRC